MCNRKRETYCFYFSASKKDFEEADNIIHVDINATDKGECYDFYTDEEREAFLDDVHPITITENRINNSFFMIWLDGKFHPNIPTCTKLAYCQYCKFKYTHKLNPSARKKNNWIFNNRGGIKQCLECNVNLCPDCFNHWHGISWDKMSDLYRS